MTESADTGDLPPKITADAPAEAQDQPCENEGEKQLENQVRVLSTVLSVRISGST